MRGTRCCVRGTPCHRGIPGAPSSGSFLTELLDQGWREGQGDQSHHDRGRDKERTLSTPAEPGRHTVAHVHRGDRSWNDAQGRSAEKLKKRESGGSGGVVEDAEGNDRQE